MQEADELIKLTDPGETGRDEHNRGDRFIVHVSNLAAWAFPILIVAICAQVVFRGIGMNQAWLDDLQWWLYGAACLVGIAYAVTTNSHVRVDIFFDDFTTRKKAVYEIIGLVWLFLPFVLLSWDVTFHYAVSSAQILEGSDSPNGLHNLWILKVFVNLSFVLVAIAVWSAYVRFLSRLTRPTLFRQLAFALPSVIFAVDLAVYYLLWWVVRLSLPAQANAREVTRHWAFGELEYGRWETPYTVIAAFVVTAVLLVAARMMERRDA